VSARLDPDPRRARVRVGVGAALMLALAALGVAVFITAVTPRGTSAVIDAPAPAETAAAISGASATIYVHILGLVARPGLYELSDGARAVDAVAAAGGFLEGADPEAVNLARFLVDGEQLIVYAEGEAPVAGSGAVVGGKVNLNTADAAILETLPRIGPAMAERILQWRETNGRFTAIEDLLSVSGIGDKTFEGLRDLVTV